MFHVKHSVYHYIKSITKCKEKNKAVFTTLYKLKIFFKLFVVRLKYQRCDITKKHCCGYSGRCCGKSAC